MGRRAFDGWLRDRLRNPAPSGCVASGWPWWLALALDLVLALALNVLRDEFDLEI